MNPSLTGLNMCEAGSIDNIPSRSPRRIKIAPKRLQKVLGYMSVDTVSGIPAWRSLLYDPILCKEWVFIVFSRAVCIKNVWIFSFSVHNACDRYYIVACIVGESAFTRVPATALRLLDAYAEQIKSMNTRSMSRSNGDHSGA